MHSLRQDAVSSTGYRELALVALVLGGINLVGALSFWMHPAGGSQVGWTDFPLDDGWIHMVYVRSIAETLRPEYNPGQLESGMTSPLWVLVNALFFRPADWLGLNPTVVPKLLSLLFGLLATMLLYVFIRRLGGGRAIAFAAGLILSMDPNWCFSRASGMEVTLFASLVMAALLALTADRHLWLGLSVALAAVTRPEGLLLVGVLTPIGLLRALREKQWGAIPAILGPSMLLLGGWATYNLAVTGHPLPNTFYVKAQTGELLRLDTILVLVRDMFGGAEFFRSRIALLFYGAGVVQLLRRGQWRASSAAIVFPWIFMYGLSVTHTFTQTEPFFWGRYFYPIYPLLLLPVFFGLRWFDRLAPMSPTMARVASSRIASLGLPVLLLLVTVAPMASSFPKAAYRFSMNCRNIRHGNVEIGQWIRRHTAPGEWIATMDAGAIRYFSDRPVLDLIGLNEHRIAHAADRSVLPRLVREIGPSHFVLFTQTYAPTIQALGLEPVLVVKNEPYTICDCPIQSEIGVFRARGSTRSR